MDLLHKNYGIPLRQKAGLIIFGLFLFLILLEIGLRIGGFIFLSLQEYRNISSLRQKGEYRILCLGESTTAGGKESYPSQLEEILNKRNIGIKFSVINKGIPAIRTSYILEQLEGNLNRYKPNMVITMMGLNDEGEHIPFEDTCISKPMLFFKSFRTYKLARLLWLHIVTKLKEIGINKAEANDVVNEEQPGPLNSIPNGKVPYKKAVEPKPRDGESYLELGNRHRDRGDYLQAEELYKKAIELNPRENKAYIELGNCYRNRGDYLQAEELYKKAIQLNPRDNKAYLELGWCYRHQSKLPQSDELYKKAIELKPRDYVAYCMLADSYILQGKYPQAEELYKKVMELKTGYNLALMDLDLGICYIFQKKYPQAEKLYKEALEKDPNSVLAYAGLAQVYRETDKHISLEQYYTKINKLLDYYNPETRINYQRLKGALDKKGIKLICVQYPMRSVEPLKKIFEEQEGIIFVDNERVFKNALKKDNYKEYFSDMFAGDFGHCTYKGNRLLAENIANVILKEYFRR
jgi:tetratricopeptide (TPR) repeat protein